MVVELVGLGTSCPQIYSYDFYLTDLLTVLAFGFAGFSLISPIVVADCVAGLPWEAVADVVAPPVVVIPPREFDVDFSMKKAFLSTSLRVSW